MYMCMYIYTHILFDCMRVYIYICIYIHTHIFVHPRMRSKRQREREVSLHRVHSGFLTLLSLHIMGAAAEYFYLWFLCDALTRKARQMLRAEQRGCCGVAIIIPRH